MQIDQYDDAVPVHQSPSGSTWIGWFGSAVNFFGSTIFSFREIRWMILAVFCFFVSNAILAFVAYRQRIWSLTTLFLAYIALDIVAFLRWR